MTSHCYRSEASLRYSVARSTLLMKARRLDSMMVVNKRGLYREYLITHYHVVIIRIRYHRHHRCTIRELRIKTTTTLGLERRKRIASLQKLFLHPICRQLLRCVHRIVASTGFHPSLLVRRYYLGYACRLRWRWSYKMRRRCWYWYLRYRHRDLRRYLV